MVLRNKFFHYTIGYIGELIVILLLAVRFYNIIKHRYKCYLGEIDIIAAKNNKLIFIEVKTSMKKSEIPISYKQRKTIIRAAKCFIASNNKYHNYEISFDAYFLSLKTGILHITNAWQEL